MIAAPKQNALTAGTVKASREISHKQGTIRKSNVIAGRFARQGNVFFLPSAFGPTVVQNPPRGRRAKNVISLMMEIRRKQFKDRFFAALLKLNSI